MKMLIFAFILSLENILFSVMIKCDFLPVKCVLRKEISKCKVTLKIIFVIFCNFVIFYRNNFCIYFKIFFNEF